MEVSVHEGKDLLDGIGGLIGVEQDAAGDRKDLIVVSRVESLERGRIAGEESFDEDKVLVERSRFCPIDCQSQHVLSS